ncbi:MAG: VanZ family protein [Bacteroidales bacterium]|nr:VanZ family protein [Bacteroidales bacterium]
MNYLTIFDVSMKILGYYHKKYIWLTGFIVWTLLIILVSMIPISKEVLQQNTRNFRLDYLEHFLAYFAFGTFYILWRGDRSYSIKGVELIILFAVACTFSFLTEYVQLLIPGRTFNIIDVVYNLAGVLSSIMIIYFYFVRYYLRKKYLSIEA